VIELARPIPRLEIDEIRASILANVITRDYLAELLETAKSLKPNQRFARKGQKTTAVANWITRASAY
jgi:hypothetical protein